MSASTDTRSAYTLKPPTYNAKLTEVTRGTPMGELLRRYWHPVGLSPDAGATPRPVSDEAYCPDGARGVEVDVTTRDSLHPLLREEIEQSALRVF